jgi:hypothetical protein
MPLTSDRWTQPCYSAGLVSVGQFRTADGLVPLSGGTLGPQMSRRSLATWAGAVRGGTRAVGVRVPSTFVQPPTIAHLQENGIAGGPFWQTPRGDVDNHQTALPYPKIYVPLNEAAMLRRRMVYIDRYK